MSQETPRIAPLEGPEWSEEVRALLGGNAEKRPLNILTTIAHQPRLLGPFLGFAAALALQGQLPKRESELLALRTAWNCQSAFEWGHHVRYAQAAGLNDDEITAIASAPDATSWSADDRALLRAADELHESQNIGDTTWRDLSQRWESGQLVEIAFVVGNYTMLSMLANSARVPLEPGLARLPAQEPHR